MKTLRLVLRASVTLAALTVLAVSGFASSHMDAPLITLDDAANTTDVYAFVSQAGGVPYLTTAVSVYPFEDPGIGPNKYNFDDNVLYEIHIAVGSDLPAGRRTLSYQFQFQTAFQNRKTILQSYLGKISNIGDQNQNLVQTYSVTKLNHLAKTRQDLGAGQTLVVPPNNQGLVTPLYNQGNDGENPAKGGVGTTGDLDSYTQQAIYNLDRGYQAFAGQREDGFYGDIQSIFDLDVTFGGPNKPFDSQAGFNVHTIALNIPVSELGGVNQVVGVYATTSRRKVRILKEHGEPANGGPWVQVGRQGNPLFCEGFVAIEDKDRYNRLGPDVDAALFAKYALEPELAKVLLSVITLPSDRLTNRTDIAGIFIPDLIKVDLSTGPAELAGQSGFNRLSIFGGDVLASAIQSAPVPGGWPNGRRFGDDVVDIGITAVASDLRIAPPVVYGPIGDNVNANDATYNQVFPYAGTPLNGRSHIHH